MSKNSDAILKRMSESSEFKEAYEEEQVKLNLADLVFNLREQTGLNQTEFAKRVKKSRSTISRIESARMEPSISLLEDIAHSLDKKIEIKLIDQDEKMKSHIVK